MQRITISELKRVLGKNSENELPDVAAPHGFVTIDDALDKAHELTTILNQLGEYKHPLDVRKGRRRKEVIDVKEKLFSKHIRDGARTYFIDVEETGEGKPYLKITESRFKGDEKERERQTVIVFAETIQAFADAVSDAVSEVK